MRRTIFSLLFLFAPAIANAQSEEKQLDDVRFERYQFAVARERGHVYLDGGVTKHPISEQPKLLSLIETFDHVKFNTDHDFFAWARELRGTRTYTYDNVIFSDAQGLVTTKPLVLLPSDERSRVEPAWQAWLAQRDAEQQRVKQQQIAYETEQALYNAQQSALDKLVAANESAARSLAVASGETSVWEVEVVDSFESSNYLTNYFPGGIDFNVGSGFGSTAGNPKYIRAYGRSSSEAANQALATSPGYQIGSVRRIAGY